MTGTPEGERKLLAISPSDIAIAEVRMAVARNLGSSTFLIEIKAVGDQLSLSHQVNEGPQSFKPFLISF